jgi:dephospho-CoA kinase
MLHVGITGGIGSGKSIACRLFELLGIPVFYADLAARQLMDEDPELRAAISRLLGPEVYVNDKLERTKVSSAVFGHPERLQALNALVHPAARKAAADWQNKQTAPYTLKEAAIFFESGTAADMDLMIGVSAPQELRVQRAMLRSKLSREQVLARIAEQMDEDEKMKLCDFVLINDDQNALIPQVLDLNKKLLKKASSGR